MNTLWETPVTLEGRHVRLEPLTEAHVPALAIAGNDARIWQFMVYGQILSEEDMRNWVCNLLRLQTAGTDLPFAVIHLASGRVAGATRYMEIRPAHRGLEIGGTWYGLEIQHTAAASDAEVERVHMRQATRLSDGVFQHFRELGFPTAVQYHM